MSSHLSAIPMNCSDAAFFLVDFEASSPEQQKQVQRLVDDLTNEGLWNLISNVIGYCYQEEFLAMIYASKTVASKLEKGVAGCLLSDLTVKARNLLLDEDAYTRLTTNLIKNYGGSGKESLLSNLTVTLHSNDRPVYADNFFRELDDALAVHVRNTPYRDRDAVRGSWLSLKAFELPKTLEVFTAQLIAGGEYGSIEMHITNGFKDDSLPASYLEAYRRSIGDDVLLGLCVGAHQVFDVPFSAIAKVTPWAGEEVFLTEKCLKGLQAALRGKSDGRTRFVDGFALAGADEIQFPLMALFVSKSLRSILRDPRDITEFKCVLPIIKMASRSGQGKQALKLMMDGMIRRSLADNIDGIEDAKPKELAALLLQNIESGMLNASAMKNLTLLLNTVEIVGLEVLHAFIPDIDGAFVSRFLESRKTNLSKGAVLKLFPQSKRYVLEHDIGL